MFSIYSRDNSHNRTKFLADYRSDIENLPTSSTKGSQKAGAAVANNICSSGSTCSVAEDGSVWILNNQSEWVEKADSGGENEESGLYYLNKYLMTLYDGTEDSITFLVNEIHNGLTAAVEMGEGVTAYICEDGYCFVLGEGEITEADTENKKSVLASYSITNMYIGEGITSIGYCAFSYCSLLENVSIPNSVTAIGDRAFPFCTALDSIVIPEGVTSIGEYMFYGSTSLSSVVIPSTVTSIGKSAFYNCSALASVEIPAGVTSMGAYAFRGCSSLTSIVIPDGVTSIEQAAFYNCSSLTSIDISENVTSIGTSAFRGCLSLTSIVIPDGVTSIGNYAFMTCYPLENIEIPSSVTSIGYGCFANDRVLTAINVESGNEYYQSIDGVLYSKDGTTLWAYPCGLQSFEMTDGATTIYIGAVAGNDNLTEIVIPEGVTVINKWAFQACGSLKTVSIASTVETIGTSVFTDCTQLETITIDKEEDSISGSPWGATNAAVVWTG